MKKLFFILFLFYCTVSYSQTISSQCQGLHIIPDRTPQPSLTSAEIEERLNSISLKKSKYSKHPFYMTIMIAVDCEGNSEIFEINRCGSLDCSYQVRDKKLRQEIAELFTNNVQWKPGKLDGNTCRSIYTLKTMVEDRMFSVLSESELASLY